MHNSQTLFFARNLGVHTNQAYLLIVLIGLAHICNSVLQMC